MQERTRFVAVEALFRQGLGVPAAERGAWLTAQLAHNPPAVVDEVRKLLRADELANTEELGAQVADHWPAAIQPLQPGDRIGEYRLIEEIGSGGMGVVWRAHQGNLDREVALKLIRSDVVLFAGVLDRFRIEAHTLAALDHPSIVAIHDAGEANGIAFLAMQFVRGKTLADWLRAARASERRLEGKSLHAYVAGDGAPTNDLPALFDGTWQDIALRIVGRVAHALETAHGSGIIHRDVKPSNIMIDGEGRVLLLDFGIARRADDDRATKTVAAIGSLPYMAPEQILGEAIDVRVDIHGLGVTLYELLTGSLPYGGEASYETMRRQRLEGRLPRLRDVRTDTSWEVDTICSKATERLAQDRYSTMRELRLDLDRTLARQPIHARRPSLALRTRRWVQRSPLRAAVAALVTLSIVLIGVLLVMLPTLAESYERETAARLERAFDLLSEARYFVARTAFTEVLLREPDHVEAHASIALTHVLEGNSEAATKRIEELPARLREQEPVAAVDRIARAELGEAPSGTDGSSRGVESPFALYLQARALRPRFEKRERDALRTARSLLLRAIYSAPAPRRIYHFELARVTGRSRDRREAAAVSDAILSLWGHDDWRVWYFAAFAIRLTDLNRCVDAYRTSIELAPDRWYTHANVASALQELRRDEEALPHAMKAYDLLPERASLARVVGSTYIRLERFRDAEAHLHDALQRHPEDFRMHLLLIHAMRAQAKNAEALARAQQLLRDDASPRVRAALTTALVAEGQLEAARAQHEIAVSEAPDDEAVLANKVLLDCRSGDDDAAMQLCRTLAGRPTNHEGLRFLLLRPWRTELGLSDQQAIGLLTLLARGDAKANMRGYALQAYEQLADLAPEDETLAAEHRRLAARAW